MASEQSNESRHTARRILRSLTSGVRRLLRERGRGAALRVLKMYGHFNLKGLGENEIL